jgi:putative membrane protein
MNEEVDTHTNDERIISRAEFLPAARKYFVVNASIGYGVFAFVLVVLAPFTLGIPLLFLPIPIGLFLITNWYYAKYYEHLSCVLTDRKLIVSRGIWNRTEQAVPLDKITDMQMNQGPIMRWLDLESMKVETAGQTAGVGGALVGIVGIKGSREFRADVLRQRDRVTSNSRRSEAPSAPAPSDEGVLTDIRDTLRRIEEHLTRTEV